MLGMIFRCVNDQGIEIELSQFKERYPVAFTEVEDMKNGVAWSMLRSSCG
jgi:hypothetical protein